MLRRNRGGTPQYVRQGLRVVRDVIEGEDVAIIGADAAVSLAVRTCCRWPMKSGSVQLYFPCSRGGRCEAAWMARVPTPVHPLLDDADHRHDRSHPRGPQRQLDHYVPPSVKTQSGRSAEHHERPEHPLDHTGAAPGSDHPSTAAAPLIAAVQLIVAVCGGRVRCDHRAACGPSGPDGDD